MFFDVTEPYKPLKKFLIGNGTGGQNHRIPEQRSRKLERGQFRTTVKDGQRWKGHWTKNPEPVFFTAYFLSLGKVHSLLGFTDERGERMGGFY